MKIADYKIKMLSKKNRQTPSSRQKIPDQSLFSPSETKMKNDVHGCEKKHPVGDYSQLMREFRIL